MQVVIDEVGRTLETFDTEGVAVGVKIIVQPRQVVINVQQGGGQKSDLSDTAPPSITTSSSVGDSSQAARGNHTHAHGSHSASGAHALLSVTGAGFAPTASGTQYAALMEIVAGVPQFNPIKQFMIQPDFACIIAGGGTLEVGQQVVTPSFTASYVGGTPNAVTLTDSDGNTPQNVSGTPNAFSSAYSFTKTANSASVSFTLAATSGSESDTSVTSYTWLPRVFYGVGVDGLATEADIEALASSALASSRARTISVSPGAGEYIYYGFPSSFGTPTFTVGGFSGGFSLAATANVTNGYGVTQTYSLWKSDNPNLGSTTVVVS